MLRLAATTAPRQERPAELLLPLRSVRPSLVDLRFTGDPWVVEHEDGTASVRLDNYRLARIPTMPFDVPSFNDLLLQLRQWQMRRRLYRYLHSRGE